MAPCATVSAFMPGDLRRLHAPPGTVGPSRVGRTDGVEQRYTMRALLVRRRTTGTHVPRMSGHKPGFFSRIPPKAGLLNDSF